MYIKVAAGTLCPQPFHKLGFTGKISHLNIALISWCSALTLGILIPNTIPLMLLKVPQLQVNKSGLIPSLIEERKGLFLGKERSWMTLHSVEELTFRTVPRSEVWKGSIKNSSCEHENGPV